MYYVVDIDNCVSNDHHRNEYARLRKWDEYHDLCHLDNAENHGFITKLHKGGSIIWLTGRTANYRTKTEEWLIHRGLWQDGDELLMRRVGDHAPAAEMKIRQLKKHLSMNGVAHEQVLCCYDDSQKIVDAYILAGFKAERMFINDYNGQVTDGTQQKVDDSTDSVISHCSDPDYTPSGITSAVVTPIPEPRPDIYSARETIAEAAQVFESRVAAYGEKNYERTSRVLKALWPEGIPPHISSSPEFVLFFPIINKLFRFVISGLTHTDSRTDIAVYAAMLETEIKEHEHD